MGFIFICELQYAMYAFMKVSVSVSYVDLVNIDASINC